MGAAVLTLWVLTAGAAAPATSPARRQEAATHFQRAVTLFEDTNFGAALVEFRAAYDAAPSYEVLFNIGLCQKKLFQYGDAVASFEAYLRQGGARISKDRRDAVAEQLEQVRALTAPLTVLAPGEPAAVYVDDELVGFTPLQRVLVGAGKKRLRLEREGFLPIEEVKEIASGPEVTLSYSLKPDPQAMPAPPPRKVEAAPPAALARVPLAPIEPARPARPLTGLGIASLSVGAAAIAAAIAFGAEGQTVSNEITGLFSRGGTWDDAWAAREAWGKTARGLSTAGVLTGIALLSAGGILTTLGLTTDPEMPALTRALVSPLPGGAFVGVGGTF